MASSWFDDSYYLSAKAAYNNANAINGITTWTVASVQASLNAAGMTAEQHYSQYGWTEGLSPNAYYVESQYVTSKVAALNAGAVGGKTDWTSADFYASLNGTNPFMHYVQYGAYEAGVEPSTGFNDDTYYADKAAYNNANAVGGITTWTADTVKAAFQANGLTPIGHYELYGATEAFYTPTPTPVIGQTYTLTTGVDTIAGTSGDDVINGVVAGTSTLNLFDSINGGAGTNTMNLNFANTNAANFNATISPTLNGVQVLNMNTMNGAMAFDGTITPDMTTLNMVNQGTAGVVTATNIGGAVKTYGLTNVTTDNTNLVVTYATGAMSGSADAVTLNLDNAKSATGTTATNSDFELNGKSAGLGVEQVTVNVATASQLGTLTSEDSTAGNSLLNTLTITGAGSLKIGTELDFNDVTNVGTINASANTGGVTLTVGAEDITFTGGSGNDRLNFAAGSLTAADSIAFGAGTNTIGLADTTLTDAQYTLVNNTGAQKVAFTAGTTAAIDMSKLTATTAVVDNAIAGNAFTKLSATDTVEVTTAAGGTATVDLTAALGFNTANLKLSGTSTGIVDLAGVTTTNQTTVNIESVGTSATANDIGGITNSANTAINVTGSGTGLTMGTLTDSTVLTATSYTGQTFSVTGANAASSFTTGSAIDTITLATVDGGDIVNTGAGDDIINTAAVTGTTATEITGGLGKDIINVTDPGAAAACKLTINATAAESYATANKSDTVAFADATAADTITTTLNTGLLTTSLAAATSATVGTTTFATAGGILWVNTAGSLAATAQDAVLYQDSNSNGLLDSTDLAMNFTTAGATDTLAISLVGSKATIAFVGV